VAVPSVLGLAQSAAVATISAAGLAVGSITQEYSATVPAGMVASQAPAAGVELIPGAAVALVVSRGPEPVPVPNVVGLTQTVAITVITAAELTVGTVTQPYSATVPPGTVISQAPEADTQVLPGSPVAMAVSKGPQPVTVPNVVGQTQTSASAAISGAGLIVGVVMQQYSATVPSGAVISQTPEAGAEALPGSAVALVISKGPQPVTVPNVVEETQFAARAELLRLGLVVGTITQRYSAAIPPGNIISQHPAAGTEVLPGTAVDLVVSNNSIPATVPDVVGLSRAQAAAAIAAAGLAMGAVTEQYSTTVSRDFVISQNPSADGLVDPGTSVNLVVSLGAAEKVTVPNVTGLPRAQAEAAITAAGLVPGAVSEPYNPSIPAGNVMYQAPSAGASVSAGTAVDLAVSRGPQPVTVPDLSGLTAEEAQTALAGVGLALGPVTEEASDTIPAGQVIRQAPLAGTSVVPGSSVNLTVSSGPVNSGCALFGKARTTTLLDRLHKMLGDLFLMGSGLMALKLMSGRRP